MAKKQKTFAEKAMSGKGGIAVCPKCDQPFETLMVVNTEKNPDTDAWKYTKSMERLCKCNEKELYA